MYNRPQIVHEPLSQPKADLAGRWLNIHGDVLCDWQWQTESKTLTVLIAGRPETEHRTFAGPENLLQLDHLKNVLPSIAYSLTERLLKQTKEAIAA